MPSDFLTDHARRVLDALGASSGNMAEWRPDMSSGEVIVVIFTDETAAKITVELIPDPRTEE